MLKFKIKMNGINDLDFGLEEELFNYKIRKP